MGVEINYSFQLILGHKRLGELLVTQKRRCFYCNQTIRFSQLRIDPGCATVDHFIPLALRGQDDISNVVLACIGCNQRKAARAPSLTELLKWNDLAARWPHIQPVALDYDHLKRCAICDVDIAWERLKLSIECDAETESCSTACHLLLKGRRRAARRQNDPAGPAGG